MKFAKFKENRGSLKPRKRNFAYVTYLFRNNECDCKVITARPKFRTGNAIVRHCGGLYVAETKKSNMYINGVCVGSYTWHFAHFDNCYTEPVEYVGSRKKMRFI